MAKEVPKQVRSGLADEYFDSVIERSRDTAQVLPNKKNIRRIRHKTKINGYNELIDNLS